MNAAHAVFAHEQHGYGKDSLLVTQDAGGQLTQGPSNAELRGAFAFDDLHARAVHAAQERLLIEIKSGQGKPADARAGKRRHGGIAVLAKDERLNAGLTDAGGLRDQPRQSGSIQKGAGGEASPSLQLQTLAQEVCDDVSRICDGHDRTADPERTQLISQHTQQLHGASEQIEACLTGHTRLTNGNNNQRCFGAFLVHACTNGHGPGKKACAVGDIERLGLRLVAAHVHKHDFLAKARAGKSIGTMAADMSCAEDDDLLSFHVRFLHKPAKPIRKRP